MAKKGSVKAKPKRARRPDRILLDVRMAHSRTGLKGGDYILAAHSLMTALSQRITEQWTSGISGYPWRIVFTGPTGLLPETPYVGAQQLATRSLQLMGFGPETHRASDPGQSLRSITQAIRDGRPVIAGGLPKRMRWSLIVGFNRRRRKLYVSDTHHRDDVLELAESGFVSRPPEVLLFVTPGGPKQTRRLMFQQSLRLAVEWARSGLQRIDLRTARLHYSGYTAYQHWITFLRSPVTRIATREEARTHARIVTETAYARSIAPLFLREGARYVPDEQTDSFEAARGAFEEVARHMGEMAALFPLDKPSLKHAEKGADILSQAFAAERLAIGHLQRVVDAFGTDGEGVQTV